MSESEPEPGISPLSVEHGAGTELSPTVFINYRHEDTQPTAWSLYDKLQERFGAENVFFDRGTLRYGEKWLGEIKSFIDRTDVFISLIGLNWLSSLIAHGHRNEVDYVATEIDQAFQAGLGDRSCILPVLVDNAEPPDASELPSRLTTLPALHFYQLRPTHLLDDIGSLIDRIEEIHASRSPRFPDPEPPTIQEQSEQSIDPIDEPQSSQLQVQDRTPVASRPDNAHFQELCSGLGNIVVVLGAGVNVDDHLPDDSDLSKYLAEMADLNADSSDLAEVAQWTEALRGEPRMFQWVQNKLKTDSAPGAIHRYLAHFPKRLVELQLPKSYQMIVTTKYDTALERAFKEENEPYDLALYMGPGTPSGLKGNFVHIPWEKIPTIVEDPNNYDHFPIFAAPRELTRTVIVRVHGGVGDAVSGLPPTDNFVITEDHYIDFLSDHTAENLIPSQILATLQGFDCLFLGYSIMDWRLRVFLKLIWGGEKVGGSLTWAVEHNPNLLEKKLWQAAGADFYECSLADYIVRLDEFLDAHREEIRKRLLG